MTLVPIVEELLVQARKFDEHIASGRQIPSDREQDEGYVASRQAIIDLAEKLKLQAMTPDMILFIYMSRVRVYCNSLPQDHALTG
jgi:hypothetical protein